MVRLTPFGLLVLTSFLFSCSLFSKRQPIGEDKKAVSEESTVSKAQYDLLLQKYEALVKEKRNTHEMTEGREGAEAHAETETETGIVAETEAGSPSETETVAEVATETAERSVDLKPELSETVNVLTGDTGATEEAGSARANADLAFQNNEEGPEKGSSYSEGKLQEEIDSLNDAKNLIRKGSYLEAMDMLKKLEKSSFKQMQVRAKFSMGEIFMKQNEYDLSMQTFEDILQNYAFSGVVLKALSQLVICSDKLKLEKKHLQYSSLLKDVFQEG